MVTCHPSLLFLSLAKCVLFKAANNSSCRYLARRTAPLLRAQSSTSQIMGWAEDKRKYANLPQEEKRKEYKCGAKFNTVADVPTWVGYAKIKNITNRFSSGDYPVHKDINEQVSIFVGDITSLEIDAIVNAANTRLAGGGGVDGAIHSAAGSDMLKAECQALGGCETGDAKITGGYKLPAKYIIHAVGPIGDKSTLLKSCYNRSLHLMEENNLKSIAFPCISTGVYGYPNENAAHVAMSSVREWFDSNPYAKQVDRIIFCLFLEVDIELYQKLMPLYFPLN